MDLELKSIRTHMSTDTLREIEQKNTSITVTCTMDKHHAPRPAINCVFELILLNCFIISWIVCLLLLFYVFIYVICMCGFYFSCLTSIILILLNFVVLIDLGVCIYMYTYLFIIYLFLILLFYFPNIVMCICLGALLKVGPNRSIP